MAYWLMKSEPESYSWDDLVRDDATEWDGVRNPAARLHLKAMQPGDEALFYHSGRQKAAVGVMTISRAWKPDGPDGSWASVEVKPGRPLPSPVTLKAMKAEAKLASMAMLRQSRLSVSPISADEWKTLMVMAKS
jgi:predicted RNA-binding protein with PUA-like domain